MRQRERYIYLEWPELRVKVRAKLMDKKNPTICNFLWKNLPMHIMQSHTMVSGDIMFAFHTITKQLPVEYVEDFTDQKYWGHVPTKIGCVKFSTMGYQIVSVQWGPDRTEPERRIPVAYVEKRYLEKLAFVGRRVLDGMSTGDVFTLIIRKCV